MMKLKDASWAMLAVNWDDVEFVNYPVIVQPKLNGIRAKWDSEKLTTRNGKVWAPNVLPTLYKKLTGWSTFCPNITLDGELYIHGYPFQLLEGIAAVNRTTPHKDEALLEFHAFDIISIAGTIDRQKQLADSYSKWVPIAECKNEKEVMVYLQNFRESGFEGLMIRALGLPYISGRHEGLIKLKEWSYEPVTIIGFKEGKDKYVGMCGSIDVRLDNYPNVTCNVSGGLTDDLRDKVWRHQSIWQGRKATIKFRDKHRSGKPVHAVFSIL